jgi:hypothetical protein
MALPTGLGFIAVGMWLVMLVMFRPRACVEVYARSRRLVVARFAGSAPNASLELA